MSETSKYNLSNAKFGGGFAGDEGTQIGGTFNDYSSTNPTTETETTSTPKTRKFLFLAANPKTTTPLLLDEEVRFMMAYTKS